MTWRQNDDEEFEELPSTQSVVPAQLSIADMQMLMDAPIGAVQTPAIEEVVEDPIDAAGAIARGIELVEMECYAEALGTFDSALKLPGSGVMRDRKKPRELTEGEMTSVLYNKACCHSRMKDTQAGILALAAALQAGLTDIRSVMTDPDLEFLRGTRDFQVLMERYRGSQANSDRQDAEGLFGGFQNLFGKF